MLVAGKFHTTDDLHELGLIDVLAEPGEGPTALAAHIHKGRGRANGRMGIDGARRQSSFVTHQHLVDTVERWVDRALEVGDDSLALIDHLVGRQQAKASSVAS